MMDAEDKTWEKRMLTVLETRCVLLNERHTNQAKIRRKFVNEGKTDSWTSGASGLS